MVNLKKTLAASALALSLALPAGTTAFADSNATSCPQVEQTFPFVLPSGILPVSGTGSLVLSTETGQNGVCSGTFTAVVGVTPVAFGAFTAIHRGSTVTVFFHTTTGSPVGARGVLFYDSSSGHGVVATKITAAGQPCAANLLIRLPNGTCDSHPSALGQKVLAGAVKAVVRPED